MYPLVGSDFNVTRAGIHADGLLKNEEIYNPFDTERVLGSAPSVALTDKSGVAGVIHWVQDHYYLPEPLAKDDPRVRRVFGWIEAEYEDGRVAALSDEELHAQIAEAFGEEMSRKPR